jgi:hypothetical protein
VALRPPPVLRSALFWSLLAAVVLFTAAHVVIKQLAKDPRFVARPNDVAIPAPRWGGAAVVDPVRARLRAVGPINLFHPRFGEIIRTSLEALPGVREVHEVRRHWPNKYSVEFSLHRPVAVVVWRGHEVPVTSEGIALPPRAYRHAMRRLVRIAGVATDEIPRLGQPWGGERLQEGLAALSQVGPHLGELNRLGLRWVDGARGDNPIQGARLRGSDGIVVRWGRPRATVGENSVGRKIGYLRQAARYVEQVRGMEIDVRYDALYVREPETP